MKSFKPRKKNNIKEYLYTHYIDLTVVDILLYLFYLLVFLPKYLKLQTHEISNLNAS